jgi:hypothetical protein
MNSPINPVRRITYGAPPQGAGSAMGGYKDDAEVY